MTIELSMHEETHYLYVTLKGTFEADAFLNACEEVLSIASDNKIMRILMDCRELTGKAPSTVERYMIGKSFAKLQRNTIPSMTCAAVIGNEPLIDPRRFGELVALNHGASGRVFLDTEEATRWIKECCQGAGEC